MPDSGETATLEAGAVRRFLTFRSEQRLYAVPAEDVVEVVRTPPVTRIPQAPKALLGLANLRGSVIPIASLSGLLGLDVSDNAPSSRSIILGGTSPVAVAVDAIKALVAVAVDSIDSSMAGLTVETGEMLQGIFQVRGSSDVARIIDIKGLLAAAIVPQARPARQTPSSLALSPAQAIGKAAPRWARYITFDVAGQEYGLGLDEVREIVPVPESPTIMPRSESVVLGLTHYRNGLLPLLSLRGLLGFPLTGESDRRERVIVTMVGRALVGLMADRMREIVNADPALMDPFPSMLAARSAGEARIKAIYRAHGGKRLISILSLETLFREDVMQRLGVTRDVTHALGVSQASSDDPEVTFLVFRLGANEFGLPIDCVEEVARVPDEITRVPKAPKFLDGVINHRGDVLPVVDQRRRFDMPVAERGETRRLIVVRSDSHRAGLIVDRVSEVLRTVQSAMEAPPELTGDAARYVNGVINLKERGRLILALDPAELLSRAERGLLNSFRVKLKPDPT